MPTDTDSTAQPGKVRNFTPLIIGVTVLIYLVIGLLTGLPGYRGIPQESLLWMPLTNAVLNSFTFVFLLIAYVAIRRRNVNAHRRFILAAFGTTFLFLITYVGYHFLAQSTRYGGSGPLKYLYLFVLLTHIVLAAVIVPLALFSVTFGLQSQLAKHRRIARWTMPLWLYVSFTGVLVYVLIRPYY